MTNEKFAALVARLEKQAQRNPGGYQRRVVLLALLGNAYVLMMLALVVVLLGASLASVVVLKAIGVKLVLVMGFFLWLLLKALWVRIPPPEGVRITAAQAPELFAIIDDLRRKLQAPRFHDVLIVDELNAAVVQTPRLGALGWYRNTLLIGLPLMKSLGVEQFKAVLAHEFGHLAGGHGRMANWIYRQRLRWSRLVAVLEASESKGSFLFKPFLNWYVPYFNAWSFPLARANEYTADATAARLTSPGAMAEALTGINVIGSYLGERYWPKIHCQADELPTPVFTPFAAMGEGVAGEIDADSAKTWLDQALARETTCDDTHPSLAERLKAIGEEPRLAPPEPGAAADRLLGDVAAQLSERFDRRWHDNILEAWQQRHREVQEGRRRLAELEARVADGGALTVDERLERARLTDSVGNDADAALAQLRALADRAPDHAAVAYHLGTRLLARDDEAGCALLERAMQLDVDTIWPACEALRDYFWRRGEKETAQAWHERLVERANFLAAAEEERQTIRLGEKFAPHGIAADVLAKIQAQLRAIPGLRRAYLLQRAMKLTPERPCHVLGFSVIGMFRLHNKQRVADALARIQQIADLPEGTVILSVDGDNYRFGRKFFWKRGARIV